MNILLLTIGSHGDVHPFVGLGIELRRRGHDVTLITNEHFKSLAIGAGLGFEQLGTDEEFRTIIRDPDVWHPTRGFEAIFIRAVLPMMEKSYDIISSRYVPGRTVVAASSLGFGARMAQEKLGVPTATVHLSPAVMRTVYDVPKLPGIFMPAWMPRAMKRLLWKMGDAMMIDRKVAPPINQFRASIGLPPVTGILRDWWHSPARVIGMWPDWFGLPQPDWPPQVRLVGFPLYDEKGVSEISPELERWLEDGQPPIAFTAGSAMVQGEEFFRTAAEACERINHRGLLLTRHREQLPARLPTVVRHADYAPFSQLLPRCAALVHHGGIGTTAQALCAGVPQLIMPMSHDQFDNAARVERLGTGQQVKQSRFQTAEVSNILKGLVESKQVREKCRIIAERFVDGHPLTLAASLLEELLSQASPTPILSEH